MRRLLLLAATALTAAALALGAAQAWPAATGNLKAPPAPKLPATIQGLAVKQEDISKVLTQDHQKLYVQGVWLYSLRQGKELMATVEIGRFRSDAPWTSPDFDLSLAGQLGGSVPAVTRVGGLRLYISTARGIELAAWFRHGYLCIAAIRNSYKSPKDLLRQLLEVTP